MLINSKAQIERNTRICILCTGIHSRAKIPVFSSWKKYSRKKEAEARDTEEGKNGPDFIHGDEMLIKRLPLALTN